jgi:uncharacterized protein
VTISMYATSIPVFQNHLKALDAIVDKAAAFAKEKDFDPDILVNTRLRPDMFPLSRQIQIATDLAKGAASRLSGAMPPSYEDDEKTLSDLKARIAKTLEHLATFKPEQIDGSEERKINFAVGPLGNRRDLAFTGQSYLISFVLPNFFFHCTMTYALFREAGLDIGKRDYLGEM